MIEQKYVLRHSHQSIKKECKRVEDRYIRKRERDQDYKPNVQTIDRAHHTKVDLPL